jgi:hypothetical protein
MLYRFTAIGLLALAAFGSAQAAPVADYSVVFDGSFNTASHPEVIFSNADVQADGLHTYYGSWGASSVSLSGVLSSGSEYTVALDFTSVARTDYTRKLLDFSGLSSQAGLYIDSGYLSFVDGSGVETALSSLSVLTPGQSFNLALTRSAAGDVTAYVNGSQQFSFQDTAGLALFNTPAFSAFILTDDNGGYEITPGVLKGVNVYKTALSAVDVASLSPTTTVPEPETYALGLAGLLTAGFLMKRRRG